MLLLHWNLLPLPLLYLSAYFERHRQQYYDLLMNVSRQGDWRGWLHFFLAGVAEQAQDAIQRAKQLQDLGYQWRTLLQEKQGTALMYNIIDLLLERPILSANDVSTRLGVAHQTAMRTFQRLIDLGILQKVNPSQRNQRFFANQMLEILQNSFEPS